MKKIIAFLAVLGLAFMTMLPVLADSGKNYVNDEAGLLTDEEETKLSAKLARLSEKYGMDIFVVTVQNYQESSIQMFCENYFLENGFGQGTERDGIMIAVCMKTRQYYICTHGRAVELFPTRSLISMEDKFVSKLSSGKYYRAFNIFANQCRMKLLFENSFLSPVWEYYEYNSGLINGCLIVGGIGGFIFSLIRTIVLKKKLKSIQKATDAASYMVPGSFQLTDRREMFDRKVTSRVSRDTDSNSGGGSGRSHSGGGGHSSGFGGHGGHF